MAEKSLVWKGKALTEKMRKAQIAGVNRTMGESVQHARDNHPWQNRTGILEGGIAIVDYAMPQGAGVEGVWGVQDNRYALALELGATIVPVNAKALAIPQPDGSVRFVKKVVIPPYPYLRPAADAIYPRLAQNIRVSYEQDGGGPSSSSEAVGGPSA